VLQSFYDGQLVPQNNSNPQQHDNIPIAQAAQIMIDETFKITSGPSCFEIEISNTTVETCITGGFLEQVFVKGESQQQTLLWTQAMGHEAWSTNVNAEKDSNQDGQVVVNLSLKIF
jgi:hypothetical protein